MSIPQETIDEMKRLFYSAVIAESVHASDEDPGPDALVVAMEYVWEEAYLAGQNDCGSDYCRA